MADAAEPSYPTLMADGETVAFAALVPDLGRTKGVFAVPLIGGEAQYLGLQGSRPSANPIEDGLIVFRPGSRTNGGTLHWVIGDGAMLQPETQPSA